MRRASGASHRLRLDRKSTRLNSSHVSASPMPSFFLVIRRPPISTLFPYPTLFRSGNVDASVAVAIRVEGDEARVGCESSPSTRSEEHTSELQSRFGISYAVFFFSDTAPPDIYSLPLPDALPIWQCRRLGCRRDPSRRR